MERCVLEVQPGRTGATREGTVSGEGRNLRDKERCSRWLLEYVQGDPSLHGEVQMAGWLRRVGAEGRARELE